MAEAFIHLLLDRVRQKVHDWRFATVDEMHCFQRQVVMIKALLQDIDGQKFQDESLMAIIPEIRKAANEAQNVIDSFTQHKKIRRKQLGCIDSIQRTLGKFVRLKKKCTSDEPTSEDREPGALAAQLRLRSSGMEADSQVVGFDKQATQVIELLVKGGKSRGVVSIVGTAGLGKTTLARKVYNDSWVEKRFKLRAWACVSKDFDARKILQSLLRSLGVIFYHSGEQAIGDYTVYFMKTAARSVLMKTRYLIVLDDIWNSSVWDEIADAFPDNSKGSRILITSRIRKAVTFHGIPSLHYSLPFLNEEDSWKLFCNKFPENEFPPELEPLGREIIQSCEGIPLSIFALARRLQTKKPSVREWSKFRDDVSWFLTNTLVNDIIKLSYNNLHVNLKPCFLSLGLFPPDYEIPFRQLVHLWVAEKFVEQSGSKDPEDIAERYLDELVDHSLIQAGMFNRRTDGGVKTFRVLRVIQEFCRTEGKKNKLFDVCTDSNMFLQSSRTSVHCSTPDYMSESPCLHSETRSFLCFGKPYKFDESHWKWLLERFKALEVLDLGKVQGLSSIPKRLEKLIKLRYLRIDTGGSLVKIDAICNLCNLETLDLSSSRIKALPKGIRKLTQLRHLYMYGDVTLPNLSGSNGEIMSKLLTLSTIALNQKNVSQLKMGTFPNLKKLGFSNSHNERNLGLLQRLQGLSHLSSLKIINVSGFATSENGFPPYLTKISLVNIANFNERCMNTLGSLPKLETLKLSEMKNSTDLTCAAGEFPRLEVFQMKKLTCQKWELAQGAMLQLRRFVLKNCENMTSLPEELWSLSELREVVVVSPSSTMVDNLKRLKMKGECKLTIDPPPDEETSVS